MLKKINKDKLKIKYLINVKTDKSIDVEDFLYEMYSIIKEKEWDNEKGVTLIQLEWSGLKYPIQNMTIEQSLEELQKQGFVKITNKKGKKYYSIIKHLWE